MPSLFKILSRSHKHRRSSSNNKDGAGDLASSSPSPLIVGTKLVKKKRNQPHGGIFRSMNLRSGALLKAKKSTSAEEHADHRHSYPTIEAAITYTLSEDENDNDIVFAPQMDIENQVSDVMERLDNEQESFLNLEEDSGPTATTTTTILATDDANFAVLFDDQKKTTTAMGHHNNHDLKQCNGNVNKVINDDTDIEMADYHVDSTMTTTAAANKRTSDNIAVTESSSSSSMTVNNKNNKNKRMKEIEDGKTTTFTHLEIMRNELAHMMQIAKKDKDMHRLEYDAHQTKMEHDAVLDSKDAVITKIRKCLNETELALAQAKSKLSNEKKEHSKTIKLLMKTQYDYHELKNSQNSWSFSSLFSDLTN